MRIGRRTARLIQQTWQARKLRRSFWLSNPPGKRGPIAVSNAPIPANHDVIETVCSWPLEIDRACIRRQDHVALRYGRPATASRRDRCLWRQIPGNIARDRHPVDNMPRTGHLAKCRLARRAKLETAYRPDSTCGTGCSMVCPVLTWKKPNVIGKLFKTFCLPSPRH